MILSTDSVQKEGIDWSRRKKRVVKTLQSVRYSRKRMPLHPPLENKSGGGQTRAVHRRYRCKEVDPRKGLGWTVANTHCRDKGGGR